MVNVDLDTFMKAISDETRRQILKELCCVWLSVNDVVDKLGGAVKQPTVSHHLRILEEANLVLVREEGRHRFYTQNREQWAACCGQLVQEIDPTCSALIIKDDGLRIIG